jgi:hypothetical protein
MNSKFLVLSKNFFIPIVILVLIGCAAKIYKSPELQNYVEKHRIVAILPFKVTIDPKKLPKEYTLEMAHEAERDEAYSFQSQLYFQLLNKHQKGEYTVEFQDVDQTNALLSKAGIEYDSLANYTKAEINKVLGVDATISGEIRRSRPMSTGAAIALGLLVGFWGSTNRVDVSINIHEGENGKLLWKYDHQASGSVASSSEGLAKSLMKDISKNFPYKKTKR